MIWVAIVADLAMAGYLAWSFPRQERHREAVLGVTTLLLVCAGCLGVLATT